MIKNKISYTFNRWIGHDLRIVLPETIYQNIIFLSQNIDFPFSDHHIFFRNLSDYRTFTENFRKFIKNLLLLQMIRDSPHNNKVMINQIAATAGAVVAATAADTVVNEGASDAAASTVVRSV